MKPMFVAGILIATSVLSVSEAHADQHEPTPTTDEQAFRAKIQPCFNPPPGATADVTVAFTLTREGIFEETPRIVQQGSGEINEAFASAAKRAVQRCAPYDAQAVEEVEVTFRADGAGGQQGQAEAAPAMLAQEAQTSVYPPRETVGPEAAEAGTPAGAETIRRALAAFTTDAAFTEGVLRVEPDPSAHRIVFDPAPLLTELPGPVSRVAIAPFSIVVSRRDNGTWNVFSDDTLDISFEGEVAGERQTFDYRIERQAFKGVYAPELGTFLSAKGYGDGSVSGQSDSLSKARSTIERTDFSMVGTPAPDGAANATFRQTMTGYAQTTAIDLSAENPELQAFSFDFGAREMLITGVTDAARTRDMLEAYVFLIGNLASFGTPGTPDGPTPALAAELIERADAVLPLWDRLESGVVVEDMTISGLLGSAAVGQVSQDIEMSGISSNAFLRVGMSLFDMSVQSEMMPAWLSPLLPEVVELGVRVENVDLAAPTAIFLEEADLLSEDLLSPDAQERMRSALDPDRIRVLLGPNRLKAGALDATMSGDVRFVDFRPAMTFDIAASGFDETIATLQAAAVEEPELHQVVGTMQLAKGFAKPLEDGRLQWQVEVAADGSVSMNGAMIKGPDAPAVEDGSDL